MHPRPWPQPWRASLKTSSAINTTNDDTVCENAKACVRLLSRCEKAEELGHSCVPGPRSTQNFYCRHKSTIWPATSEHVYVSFCAPVRAVAPEAASTRMLSEKQCWNLNAYLQAAHLQDEAIDINPAIIPSWRFDASRSMTRTGATGAGLRDATRD